MGRREDKSVFSGWIKDIILAAGCDEVDDVIIYFFTGNIVDLDTGCRAGMATER